ncbi:hypothetical protein L218DRAFT_858378 [Marasmius fiardii PR-910]|nr:hypothetical protein L218DRAFT_858378 [Marasmius fiardii PR-910]
MTLNGVDRKDRAPSEISDSHRNVVDHDAANGRPSLHNIGSSTQTLLQLPSRF